MTTTENRIELPKIEDHSDFGIPYVEPSPELTEKFLGANHTMVIFALLKLPNEDILKLPDNWDQLDSNSQLELINNQTN